jgi:hypothetical protein
MPVPVYKMLITNRQKNNMECSGEKLDIFPTTAHNASIETPFSIKK